MRSRAEFYGGLTHLFDASQATAKLARVELENLLNLLACRLKKASSGGAESSLLLRTFISN